MYAYYLKMALVSLKRTPVIAALLVGAVALGIGASMTTLTAYYSLSGDPIPHKSRQLHAVQLDVRPTTSTGDDPPTQVTWIDAQNLMAAQRARRQNASFITAMPVRPADGDVRPYQATARVTYRDFFEMFDVPFAYGGAWGADADREGHNVVVLGAETNERVFGGEDSVGRELRIGDRIYQVVGVLRPWRPVPKFYDLENGSFNDTEQLYIPFGQAARYELPTAGNTNCNSAPTSGGFAGLIASECVWLQMWVELHGAREVDEYREFIDAYTDEQRAAGRFPRENNNRVTDMLQVFEDRNVVGNDSRVLVGLSFMFLLICLLNTVGLLLAKFLRRAGETGLRRALGASKLEIFRQQLTEVGLMGLAGGALGVGLTVAGVAWIRTLYPQMAHVFSVDWVMVFVALGLALVSALLAGLYPAWRVCQVPPASYLKTQ